ncbi:MAG TPA: ABC transporter permease [Pyrinomonadaceae bacterium]|nr:ABC transporter permease [Pyrinomonadaceae bacterium]
MDTLIKDFRYGIRSLLRRPGFSIIVIVVLGLGIGATSAIFSVVDALMLRSMPYPQSERLVLLREVNAKGNQVRVAEPNFEDMRAQSKSFEALAIAAGSFPLVVTGPGEAARVNISYASGDFFKAMGVQPLRGRSFQPEEEQFGGPVAAVLSYGYWQKALGGRSDLNSVKINIDGVACNVVGVMPPSFDYPADTAVWMTRNAEPGNTSRTAHNWPVIGRLRPGITIEQAGAEVSLIGQQLKETYGKDMDAVDFALVPLQSFITRNVSQGLWLLLGAVGLLLLIACANYSNLLLAQLTAREREFVVRRALGASRLRLTRQLLVENVLLTIPAAISGVLLASLGLRLLLMLDNGNLPRVNTISIDNRVLLFACGLAILIAVVLSFLPVFQNIGHDLNSGLKSGGRGQVGVGHRLRGAMVTGQVGLTIVLLAGAGLLARSFLNLMKVDPGFSPQSAVVMTLSLPTTITPEEDERIRQFYVGVLDRVGQLPGVMSVGGINALPLNGGSNGTFLINNDLNQPGQAEYRIASAGYFPAMKIPLLKGRLFGSEDTVNSQHVAVISESLAQKYWSGADPIGKRIQFGNMDTDKRLLQIVGVVGDVRSTLEREVQPTVYAFSLQRPQWWQVARLSIVVRAQTDPEALIPALRSTVQGLRADVPSSFETLEQVLSSAFDARRFTLMLFGIFGGVALLITLVGVYGMLSYSVAERRQEIGIRMALGAQPGSVLLLVIAQGLRLTIVGIAIGLAGAWGLTRLMSNLLYGVRPTDPITFAVVGLLLLLVALFACLIPARRATRVDPLEALRCD